MESQHPFLNYWSDVYADQAIFYSHGICFNGPFANPLMSPRFVTGSVNGFVSELSERPEYFNVVSLENQYTKAARAIGYECTKSFAIGVTLVDPLNLKSEVASDIVKLESASQTSVFWDLLKEGFTKDFEFLKQLITYLPQTKARYYSVFLRSEKNVLGLINVGICGENALVFNAVISSAHRQKGLTHDLVANLSWFLKKQNVKNAIFWTEHNFLERQASNCVKYQIFTDTRR